MAGVKIVSRMANTSAVFSNPISPVLPNVSGIFPSCGSGVESPRHRPTRDVRPSTGVNPNILGRGKGRPPRLPLSPPIGRELLIHVGDLSGKVRPVQAFLSASFSEEDFSAGFSSSSSSACEARRLAAKATIAMITMTAASTAPSS